MFGPLTNIKVILSLKKFKLFLVEQTRFQPVRRCLHVLVIRCKNAFFPPTKITFLTPSKKKKTLWKLNGSIFP